MNCNPRAWVLYGDDALSVVNKPAGLLIRAKLYVAVGGTLREEAGDVGRCAAMERLPTNRSRPPPSVRPGLHACTLTIAHPVAAETVTFTAP